MAFHHRKLLDESLNDLASICEPYCDAAKSTGKCVSTCSKICPPEFCKEITSLFPPPPPPSSPPPLTPTIVLAKTPKLSLLLTASLAVLATAFFIFTCYTIYRFYAVWRNSRRRMQPQRRQPVQDGGPDEDLLDEEYGPVVDHPIWYIRTIGLQPSVINAITTVKYKLGDGLVDGTDCAVCLSEFQEDETLRLLPKCNHAFHIPCIDTWLASHTNCPMCRAGIVSNAAGPVAPQDPAPHDSGRVEEVSRNEWEARIGIVDDGPGRSESGPEMNENVEGGGDWKSDVGGEEGVQGVRRSVSMDSISASMISAAVANALRDLSNNNNNNNNNNNSDKHEERRVGDVGRRSVGVNRDLLRLASTERCMQTGGSSSIKRSASCSANVFLSRHSSSSR